MAYKPVAGAQMAAPNVIPMADIMLVLLIIFMVVTPDVAENPSGGFGAHEQCARYEGCG